VEEQEGGKKSLIKGVNMSQTEFEIIRLSLRTFSEWG